jgi:hypothetical protein
MKSAFLALFLIALGLLACDKKEPAPKPVPPPPVTPAPVPSSGKQGTVSIEFMNRVGTDLLQFDQGYKLITGDSITVTKFNYYISNIVLVGKNGNTFIQPESYFVVRHPDLRKLTVASVPSGTYTSIRFCLGVDSTRNCSGAQTGGLDLGTNGDMYWSWNSGYIFMKVEGHSPQSGATGKSLTYHIGGFKGENRAQRNIQIDLGTTPLLIDDNAAHVKLGADLNKVFMGSVEIDPATLYNVMSPGEGAKKIADNYSGMCSLESVQN